MFIEEKGNHFHQAGYWPLYERNQIPYLPETVNEDSHQSEQKSELSPDPKVADADHSRHSRYGLAHEPHPDIWFCRMKKTCQAIFESVLVWVKTERSCSRKNSISMQYLTQCHGGRQALFYHLFPKDRLAYGGHPITYFVIWCSIWTPIYVMLKHGPQKEQLKHSEAIARSCCLCGKIKILHQTGGTLNGFPNHSYLVYKNTRDARA